MLLATWQHVREHAADPPLGVKGSWVQIPPSRQRKGFRTSRNIWRIISIESL